MITVLYHSAQVRIPSWVVDLDSFRRWADADDFPETGRIWFLKGEVWVDMSKEQVFTHALLKTELAYVLTGLVKAGGLGTYIADGPMLTNETADISCKPDGIFIANVSLQSGRVRLVEGMEEGYLEVEGSPDMVLEVVSPSSENKDRVVLRQAYWEAGIREYWLVDARREPLSFDILRHGARGYTATRKSQGWIRSAVFGKAFRLTAQTTPLGHPSYALDIR
jgi:Uma2 family endonuclease